MKWTSALAASLASLFAVVSTVGSLEAHSAFGPKTYVRQTGTPQRVVERFTGCGSESCQLIVTNGNGEGFGGSNSATVYLNGRLIIGPRDLHPHVRQIVKDVTLADNNELEVRWASNPGSSLTLEVTCPDGESELEAGRAAASLIAPGQLSVAVPLENEGDEDIATVVIQGLSLTGADLVQPSLPVTLGPIEPEGAAVLNAVFSSASFQAGATYVLTITGRSTSSGRTSCFVLNASVTLPADAPGTATLASVNVDARTVTGAPYPSTPPAFENEREAKKPAVPLGILRPIGAPPGATVPQPAPTQGAVPGPRAQAGIIDFERNLGLGENGSSIAEPSGATNGGDIVFVSANSFVAFSSNGGATFTRVDPTTVFPADEVGFCCDQIVQYSPSVDRFFWLIQGSNGYRLATASAANLVSSGATAWTYWNLTPAVFGESGSFFDFPDLALGDNYLYLSWDASGNRQVARTSLAGLQAGGTITVEYTDPAYGSTAWSAHLTQNTGNAVYWAGHKDNSTLRIFAIPEGGNTYSWRDRSIGSWSGSGLTSITPDGNDWLKDVRLTRFTSTLGATRSFDEVWFAWNAGTDGNFPKPHVELVALDLSKDFSVLRQVAIWNPNFAFAYPALAGNPCTGEIGMSLAYGGDGNYENHVVGFWGDFIVYVTTASTAGTNRYGDYVTIRRRPTTQENPGNLFDAFGFGLNANSPPATGVSTDIRYVAFGRPAASCVIGAPSARTPVSGPATGLSILGISPNPMTQGTTVSFFLPHAEHVHASLYDPRGRLVSSVLDEDRPSGINEIRFARTLRGRRLSSGIYMLTLIAGDENTVRRILVLN